jgi:CRP-like cAMP-binding protein
MIVVCHVNRILLQMPPLDREQLLDEAELIDLPLGHAFARAGDLVSTAYFPNTGVIAVVSEMTTGSQVAVDAVGAEGMLGLGSLLGTPRYPLSFVVLVPSRGYRIPAQLFRSMFERSEAFRGLILQHIGGRMWELMITAACNRVHSHRQRLARWLLVTTDKAQQQSLSLTHEALAQMVGGPRHAVTNALNELREQGAIARLRGRIEIVKRSDLAAQACECYARPADFVRL